MVANGGDCEASSARGRRVAGAGIRAVWRGWGGARTREEERQGRESLRGAEVGEGLSEVGDAARETGRLRGGGAVSMRARRPSEVSNVTEKREIFPSQGSGTKESTTDRFSWEVARGAVGHTPGGRLTESANSSCRQVDGPRSACTASVGSGEGDRE